MEIGSRIKEIRTAVGFTQAKFGERIAVAKSYISELESGVKDANERIIRLICAEFNIRESWLRTGSGAMYNEDISSNLSEVMGMFKTLDKRFQTGALQILAVLVELNESNCGNLNK